MGYENGLGNGLPDAPEISLPGGGGEWEGEGPLSTSESPEVKAAIAFAKATWNAYKPIAWQDESGMQAVTQTQNTVVAPVKITKKPRGSWINTKYGTIRPGDVVVEVARGTASSVLNSYVNWKGISGWVRTGELVSYSPIIDFVDYSQAGSTPYSAGPDAAQPVSYFPIIDFVDYSQAGSSPYSAGPDAAQSPAKKLPILPIAAIGYFLLNR